MPELPSGTLTFLFTDVRGSTALVQDAAKDGKRRLISIQDTVREGLTRQGGHEVHCSGDGFFFAFSNATAAAEGALQVQEKLAGGPIQVRIGMHTGHADQWNGEYMGVDVHRAARIAAVAQGGQILMSRSTRELVTCDVLDLGLHRLKDLVDPLHLYQAGLQSFAAVESVGRSNLPAPSTPFVGRVKELAAANRLLDAKGVRLVTLTGPGGIGKTRLALELARRRVVRHPEGSWWVDLASISDSSLVPELVSKVIGAHGDVAHHLGQRKCAVVLDNFEHLQDAAGFVGDLVGRCEGLEVIVTSRSPLRLASEWRFAVEPLAEAEAVSLFCARALAAGVFVRKSEQIAAICRRVENVPLALELAAAKSGVLSPSELLSRLEGRLYFLSASVDDVPDRHRTLRATVQWSYELLGAKERVTFCNLAVFAGGWSPQTAQRVFGADLDDVDELVRKSFVRVVNGRFSMLELIREFGLEKLDASPTQAKQARRLHRDYFLGLVEEQHRAQNASSMNWRSSFEELEGEHENIHAALLFSTQYLEDQEGRAAALRFCAALGLYWTSRWHCQEGLRACLLALEGRREDSDISAVANTLSVAAWLSTSVGDLGRASLFYDEALTLVRKSGHPTAEAMVTSDMGHLSYLLAEFETAKSHFTRLEHIALEVGDEKLAANAHYGMARVALAEGRTDIARKNLDLAFAGYVKVGHRSNQALALLYRGVLAIAEADDKAAERHLCDALLLARETGEAMNESCILRCLGDVEAGRGKYSEARVLLRDALLSNVHSDDIVEVALGLRSAAMLSFREGDFGHGATLLGAVMRAGRGIERLLDALLSETERELVAAAHHALGSGFEVFERKGAGMNTQSAIEAVLRNLSRKASGRLATLAASGV